MRPSPSPTDELRLADAHCRRLLRGHYENFFVSTPLLPPRLRPHFARVYAFCRTTDDLGDESGGAALERLAAWERDLERCFGGGRPLHPVLIALAETVRAFRLPKEPFFDLVAANVQDQRVSAYPDWEQLRAYCQLSAAPVGRIVLFLFGVSDPTLISLSDDVCVGLQLANFAQDVCIDAAKGRTYLVGEELEQLGVPGAVRALCQRARGLLASGRALEAELPLRPRLQVRLYRLGGEAILEAVARAGYRTDLRRPQLGPVAKLGLFPRGVLGLEPEVRRQGAHRLGQG